MSTATSAVLLEEALTCLNRFDRPDLALTIVAGVLEREPSNPMALSVAAMVSIRMGHLGDAETMIDRAVALTPADSVLHRLRADILLLGNRPAEAIAALTEASRLNPTDAPTLVQLGGVRLRSGDIGAATAAYRAAVGLDPDNPDARKQLLVLSLEAHDLDEAAAHYRALLRIDGQDQSRHLVLAAPIMGLGEWCAAHGARYRAVAPAAPALIYPPRFFGDPPPAPVVVTRPETYVAEIADATVIGAESLVISSDGRVLWDLAGMPGAERFDLAEGIVRYAEDGVAMLDAGLDADAAGAVAGAPAGAAAGAAAAAAAPIEVGIHMACFSSTNYYHFMVELITRFAALDALADPALGSLPLLVDEDAIAVPQLLEALRVVAGPDRAMISLKAGVARRVRRLVIPSPLSWMPNNQRDGLAPEPADTHVSAEAIRYIRKRLVPPDVHMPERGTRRVCILKPTSRRLQNSAELADLATEMGFEIVRPESLSQADQIRLFAQCDVIVGETGAALANILFAPSRARIVVLVGDKWQWSIFSQVAAVVGQSMTFVVGRVTSETRKIYQSPFVIDRDNLRTALAAVLAQEPADG
jgi:Tfp pilus assembly protein PilF